MRTQTNPSQGVKRTSKTTLPLRRKQEGNLGTRMSVLFILSRFSCKNHADLDKLWFVFFWQAIYKLSVPLAYDQYLAKLAHGNKMLQNLRLFHSRDLRKFLYGHRTLIFHPLNYKISFFSALLHRLRLFRVHLRFFRQGLPFLRESNSMSKPYIRIIANTSPY